MQKWSFWILGAVLMGIGSLSVAAEHLFVMKSVEVGQPADVVWRKVADFGDLGAWHPAVAKTALVAGHNNQPGAQRLLTLQDGGTIHETLTAYDAKAKSYTYKIDGGVLPVNGYVSSVSVHENGAGKSVVVWQSEFLPKAPADEKTASETIKGVYDAGLNQLQKILH